ncbi:hypothetical protein FN976_23980 [Caenimonas sedimenti]|uniref:Uncharacterized protein n=1 Tax=Caenimonas sedimenti TaxID=2596921 RepID=A0A562ZHE0_9BURK|nr:hypothetical protein [Caenimonas sedimenti]TWO68009.1 hypothetical protein FN976_23980 [Caenimonas sedimenti]
MHSFVRHAVSAMAVHPHEQREVPMFQPMLARWLAVSASLLTLAAVAQTPAAPPARAAASAPVSQTQAAPGEYRSALEGYQPYSEGKMVPWKEANDTVGKIGGWRAYAKEAAERQAEQGHAGHTAPAATAPKPAASQTKP